MTPVTEVVELLRRVDDGDPFNAGWNAALDAVTSEHGACFYVYGPDSDQCPHGIRAKDSMADSAPTRHPYVDSMGRNLCDRCDRWQGAADHA